jgi:hypothetical protein
VRALGLQVEQQAREVVVDEQQVQQVAVLRRQRGQRREEGRLGRVPGQDVERRPDQHRRPGQQRVEQPLQPRADRRGGDGAGRRGVTGQVHRMGALRGRQPQRPRQRLQHLARRPRGTALLDQRQPGRADPGPRGDLLAPQPARTAAPGRLEAERLRGHALAARAQQVAERAAAEGVVHRHSVVPVPRPLARSLADDAPVRVTSAAHVFPAYVRVAADSGSIAARDPEGVFRPVERAPID